MHVNENGKVTVYDLDGVAREKEPVDAKECVERLGWTLEPVIIEPVKKTKGS